MDNISIKNTSYVLQQGGLIFCSIHFHEDTKGRENIIKNDIIQYNL
jgi:hypothetical protein